MAIGDHLRHSKPQPIPPNYCIFHCPSYVTKTQLARCHRVKTISSLSFFCEKHPSLVLYRPYHTSMAIGNPLRHPKPQFVPPNYCVFPLSKLYDKNTATSKVSLSQKNIISIIVFVKRTLVWVFRGHIIHLWP